MKRILSLALLLGALTGLFGQAAAVVASPHVPVAIAASQSPMDDCAQMMAPQPAPEEQPCKGLTLDCIKAMGCVLPFTLADEASLIVRMPLPRIINLAARVQPLLGRSIAPDPDPPSLLI